MDSMNALLYSKLGIIDDRLPMDTTVGNLDELFLREYTSLSPKSQDHTLGGTHPQMH